MLILFDKDGTLVRPKSGAKFVSGWEDQELLPNVGHKLMTLQAQGALMAVCSNQGGIAAGHKSYIEAQKEFKFLLHLLPEILCCFFCPDFEGTKIQYVDREGRRLPPDLLKNSEHLRFRKPEPGMLILAKFCLDQQSLDRDCLFVGDRPEDEGAAAAAGFQFAWAADFFDWWML